MVSCLLNSKMVFHPGLGVQLNEELLLKSNVPQYWTRFSLIHHPAFMSYAFDFHQKVGVDRLRCRHGIFGSFLVCCLFQRVRSQRWIGVQPICTVWFKNLLVRQGGKCGINVSFIEDTLIQKDTLLLMAAA